jgi:Protein of unknown function (DUF1822)
MVSDLTSSTTFDALPQSGDWVDLDVDAIKQASTLSQSVTDPQCRWQSYLALLALEGFQTWLTSRATPIHFDRYQARLLEPTGFDLPAVVMHVRLNEFRICLIPVSSVLTGDVEIPAIVVDYPGSVSHFYVTVAVNPEGEAAQVQGFLPYDRLMEAVRAEYSDRRNNIQTYELPDNIFDTNLEHLLLFANSLNPSAIPLPQLALATNVARSVKQLLIQPIVKASAWFDRQITSSGDSVNQLLDEIAGMIGPAVDLRTADGFRSTGRSEFEPMRSIRDIDVLELGIPEAAAKVDHEVRMGNRVLRLSVVMWELPLEGTEREWSLLAFLKPLSDDVPEGSVRLAIADDEKTLVERILAPGGEGEMAQAIGFLEEQLTISLAFESGDVLRLSPFQF